MTAGQINRELDRLDELRSRLNDEMIDVGRGHERPSDYMRKQDPLSRKFQALFDRRTALGVEVHARYGPGAPSRLPARGFGRRVRNPTGGPEKRGMIRGTRPYAGSFVVPVDDRAENPATLNPPRRAETLYRTFHQFGPDDVGYFARDFRLPEAGKRLGDARVMYYTSDKLNPTTGEDEGFVSYYHEHGPGVVACGFGRGARGDEVAVPAWIRRCESLVLIGRCDGFEYESPDGRVLRGESSGRAPEWFATPSGRALVVVQDRERPLAAFWGGDLRVEARGVVD